jgi:hypothetical protein
MSATTLAVEVKPIKQPKALLAPNSDFYHFAEALPAAGLALVKKVRTYMKTEVAPIIFKYWAEDLFSGRTDLVARVHLAVCFCCDNSTPLF